MNSLHINSASTWKDIEVELDNEIDRKVFLDGEKSSFGARIRAAFTGETATTDKIKELVKDKIKAYLSDTFDVAYGEEEQLSIDYAYEHLMQECELKNSDLKTLSAVEKLFKKIDGGIFYTAGTIASIYPDSNLKKEKTAEADAENVLKILMGAPFNTSVISPSLLKAVLISKDKARMEALKTELEALGKVAFDKLNSEIPVSVESEKLYEALIGNLLALYPFTEPTDNSQLQIPQKIAGKWALVTYTINHLPVSPSWLGEPIPAYGLKPQNNEKASPLLLFRGTPQPTASGSLLALASDIVPGYSVGEIFYEHAEKNVIQPWIEAAHKEFGKVKIFGQSLGGSLSLLTLSRQPDKVCEVNVYGSPALLNSSLKIYEERTKGMAQADKPKVNLYWNNGDPVPLAGAAFHQDWNLYKVIIPARQNGGLAHASLNVARPKVLLMKLDPKVDSCKTARRVTHFFHQLFSVLLLPFTGLIFVYSACKALMSRAGNKISKVAKSVFQKNRESQLII